MELKAGSQLQNGKYLLEKKIGEGGFGITYKGVWKIEVPNPLGKTTVDYQVAIKEFFFEEYCFRDEKTGEISTKSEKGQELFIRFKDKLKKEASILLELEHPNIVNVSEVFEENNTAYMVMEFIDGENLKDFISHGKLTMSEALRYIKQIAEALQYIHSHNIIHLDVKPANILIDNKTGTAKLIDFGIAKQYTDTSLQTQAATVAAFSKGYSPIEQYAVNRKEKYGAHTDVYALGATLYHCLTGEIPTEAAARLSEDLVPPSRYNPEIPSHVEKAIMKAMELKHKDRFPSVSEFLAALNEEELSDSQKSKTIKSNIPAGFEEIDTKYIIEPNQVTRSNKEKKTVVSSVKTETNKKKDKTKEEKKKTEKTAKPKESSPEKKTDKIKIITIVAIVILIIGIGVCSVFLFQKEKPVVLTETKVLEKTNIEPETEVISSEKSSSGELAKPENIQPLISGTTPSQEQKTERISDKKQPAISNAETKNSDQLASVPTSQTQVQTPEPVKTPAVVKTISINGNKYTGEVRNGKPDGKGKLIYAFHERISELDPKSTMSEVGDYLEGKWNDGELEYGTLYDKNGVKKKTVIVGK